MKHLFARVVCRFKGHIRGKHVPTRSNQTERVVACPRCGTERAYPIRAAK